MGYNGTQRNKERTSVKSQQWGAILTSRSDVTLILHAFRLYRRAFGNRDARARPKRFWTEDHYHLSAMSDRQAHWLKEEPPRTCAGECQKARKNCLMEFLWFIKIVWLVEEVVAGSR